MAAIIEGPFRYIMALPQAGGRRYYPASYYFVSPSNGNGGGYPDSLFYINGYSAVSKESLGVVDVPNWDRQGEKFRFRFAVYANGTLDPDTFDGAEFAPTVSRIAYVEGSPVQASYTRGSRGVTFVPVMSNYAGGYSPLILSSKTGRLTVYNSSTSIPNATGHRVELTTEGIPSHRIAGWRGGMLLLDVDAAEAPPTLQAVLRSAYTEAAPVERTRTFTPVGDTVFLDITFTAIRYYAAGHPSYGFVDELEEAVNNVSSIAGTMAAARQVTNSSLAGEYQISGPFGRAIQASLEIDPPPVTVTEGSGYTISRLSEWYQEPQIALSPRPDAGITWPVVRYNYTVTPPPARVPDAWSTTTYVAVTWTSSTKTITFSAGSLVYVSALPPENRLQVLLGDAAGKAAGYQVLHGIHGRATQVRAVESDILLPAGTSASPYLTIKSAWAGSNLRPSQIRVDVLPGGAVNVKGDFTYLDGTGAPQVMSDVLLFEAGVNDAIDHIKVNPSSWSGPIQSLTYMPAEVYRPERTETVQHVYDLPATGQLNSRLADEVPCDLVLV